MSTYPETQKQVTLHVSFAESILAVIGPPTCRVDSGTTFKRISGQGHMEWIFPVFVPIDCSVPWSPNLSHIL